MNININIYVDYNQFNVLATCKRLFQSCISIKLYKEKPDFKEYSKQMERVAGHEFGK